MSVRWWRVYLAAMMLAVAGYVPVTLGPWAEMSWSIVNTLGPVAVIVFAVARLPRSDRTAWHLLALGILANGAAVVPNTIVSEVLQSDAYPTVADAFYLLFYPAVLGSIGLMIRRWPPRLIRPAMLDAATITSGIGVLAWVYAIDPALQDGSYSLFGQLVRVAYPVGDLLLIFMALILVRSNSGAGTRRARWGTAPPWLATGLLCFLGGDLIWLLIGAHSVPGWVTRGVDVFYFAAFVILGYAARHATATDVQRLAAAPRPPGIPLMSMLLLALLMAPAVLLLQTSHDGFQHGAAIAAGSTIMSVLVVTRLTVLLRFVERQSDQVRELARRDELTGLPNRRAWGDELPRVLEHARQSGRPVSICMLDLDHFKAFNDTRGHQAGDRLLKEAAAAWTGQLRQSDLLARYGGEEFIILLPSTDIHAAGAVIERLRPVTPAAQTFSCGVAVWNTTETSDELIARADAALYEAKHAGRNRTVAASAQQPPAPLPASTDDAVLRG
ncbi:GGDEF domain-containing protein [Dactylosporangium matsuzakiense]|uniref:GGDEF domain-containing protein n=1 Tax=Dactylosporangium matsuzakiense TaxID=53360 RepID=UPI0021C45A36|nr:GGDEF domain-containing protein [Dactylosporangium matsuzakiense]UWZ41418.1 GGDEF domain-containing protein [Dactylosporangium matsuzakiense]